MNPITSASAYSFLKRYQFRGGRIRAWRMHFRADGRSRAEARLLARESSTGKMVRVRLMFEGVEEYRMQRRPGAGPSRVTGLQIGFFGDLVYLNFDPFEVDGPPKVIDFRASDSFVGAKHASWEIIVPTPPSTDAQPNQP